MKADEKMRRRNLLRRQYVLKPRSVTAHATLRLWRLTPTIALATVIALLSAGALLAHYVDRATERQEVDEVSVQARGNGRHGDRGGGLQ